MEQPIGGGERRMRENRINVGRWIAKWALTRPEKVAVHSDGRSLTYREFEERIGRFGNLLSDLGISKGDRVAILLYNTHEYLEIFFALSRMGAIAVPLNFRLAFSEIQYILKDSGACALFFGTEFADLVGRIREAGFSGEKLIAIGEKAASWATACEDVLQVKSVHFPPLPREVGDEDPQILMYTSGTTGVPKGVVLSHRKTFYNSLNTNIYYGLTHDDSLLITRALFHSGGLLVEALPMLYKGGTIVMRKRFRPAEILKAVEAYRITVLELPATTLKFILEQCDLRDYDLTSLKCCFTGGERVPPALLRECMARGIAVSQIYGQTETSTLTWLPMGDAARKMGSVGIPVFHGDVKVVNKGGEQVRPGEVGEIVVSGPITMSFYWGRPDLTEQTIREGWLHTGDLATVDEEGFFYVVDREKDMFISGGENVYPAEVEKVYLENPKISNVAVVGIPDEKWGEVGLVCIVLKEGEVMTEAEALGYCDGKIARYKIPKIVKFMTDLPMTAAQKIKRNRLREAYLEEQANRR
jgi:fatty-acyl-CoA synthase